MSNVHGNKKDPVLFFKECKKVIEILGDDFKLSENQKQELVYFFEKHNDGDRSMIWRKNIANWIQRGLSDWASRRELLNNCTSNSKKWYEIHYGEHWELFYNQKTILLRENLPTTIEYWVSKGYTEGQADQKISEHQTLISKDKKRNRKQQCRCLEYWTSRGYGESESRDKISSFQRRDKDFFISKYGEVVGEQKFLDIKNKRKKTWETKDRYDHGKRSTPKSYNPNGQEMQAIYGFLEANSIPQINCKFGSPKSQFWQFIPQVGYRRYDLAVFSDETHGHLKYIMEFHGPGHINFSDFVSELQHERITIGGKKLAHLGTYGEAYYNDWYKRQHIIDKFTEVMYIVMWADDLKNRRFNINELLSKRD